MAIIKSTIEGTTGSSVRLTCDDCKAWAWEGQEVRHSKRCDNPIQDGHVSAAEKLPVLPASGLRRDDAIQAMTDDERFDAYKRGRISQSEAMNTDF